MSVEMAGCSGQIWGRHVRALDGISEKSHVRHIIHYKIERYLTINISYREESLQEPALVQFLAARDATLRALASTAHFPPYRVEAERVQHRAVVQLRMPLPSLTAKDVFADRPFCVIPSRDHMAPSHPPRSATSVVS